MKPRVTPLILSFNEEVNLGRTLAALTWAERIVVLDSGSTDRTRDIAIGFPNVTWLTRPFDTHGQQWRFGIQVAGEDSDYVLALDADMQMTSEFVGELEERFLTGDYVGGVLRFRYLLEGHPLFGSLYPSQLRLFRPKEVEVRQPGHTQEFVIAGSVYHFKTPVYHDDRKSLERFVTAQLKYTQLNFDMIQRGDARLRDRIRLLGLGPPLGGLYAYLRAGGPLKGYRALRYAYERTIQETLLAIRLLNNKISGNENR
jgi:glycosyltransferase involved in cell wall biosynthesis